jgi:hypothetical protein
VNQQARLLLLEEFLLDVAREQVLEELLRSRQEYL